MGDVMPSGDNAALTELVIHVLNDKAKYNRPIVNRLMRTPVN